MRPILYAIVTRNFEKREMFDLLYLRIMSQLLTS